MGDNPTLKIDLGKLEANARLMVELCAQFNIDVVGVVKGTCAMPEVGRAFMAGGIKTLADARVDNLKKLRAAGFTNELLLLRIPMLSEIRELIATADCALVSAKETIECINKEAEKQEKTFNIIQMIDMGDLREGIWYESAMPHFEKILSYKNVNLVGVGANFACYGALVPTAEMMEKLLAIAEKVRSEYNIPVKTVSGGNSANVYLLQNGKMPAGINQLRLGEALLQGREALYRNKIVGAHNDCFVLRAEIIEVEYKPTMPIGETAQDAFGRVPVFVDKGKRYRAIAAVGRQDVDVDGLVPREVGVEIFGASSDHLILDVTEAERTIRVGDTVEFDINYSALLRLMTSPYVHKQFV